MVDSRLILQKLFLAFTSITVLCASGRLIYRDLPHPAPPTLAYQLVWSDEFSGPDGSLPDPKKWAYDLGGKNWGNKELESYTDRPENVHIEKGNLVITARRESYKGADGVTRDYTSARIKTKGRLAQAYGRFEARIKIPRGQGMWPAFWMLGDNSSSVGWPKCGEIDIMENVGKEPAKIHGSLHGPSAKGRTSDRTSVFTLPEGQKFADEFHVYAIEWEPNLIRFYVDANLYATFDSSHWPAGGTWVFDHPFFLILNLAVGGKWPGNPRASTQFPQSMLVDYVRVYTRR